MAIDDYEKFRGNMDRYEREKKDKEDAERWRHQEEMRAASREKPKEPVPAEHPFRK